MLFSKVQRLASCLVLGAGLFTTSAAFADSAQRPPALPMAISGSIHTVSGTVVTNGTIEALLGTSTSPAGTISINNDGTFGGQGLNPQLIVSGSDASVGQSVQFLFITQANPSGVPATISQAVTFTSGDDLQGIVLTVPDSAFSAPPAGGTSGGAGGAGSSGGGVGGASGASTAGDGGSSTPVKTTTSVQQTVDTGTNAASVATSNNSIKVDLQQGTFDKATTLKINQTSDTPQAPTNLHQMTPAWSFDAAGQEPKKPVNVTFQLNQPLQQANGLALYTAADGGWKFMQMVQADANASTVTVTLPHFSVWTVMQVGTNFPDVTTDSWAYGDILELVARQAVSGYEDGYFGPSDLVTRGQFVRMLDVAIGLKQTTTDPKQIFHDVAADAWYAPYIETAQQNGILSGDNEGNVHPDSPISRQEAAAILARVIGMKQTSGEAQVSFTDNRDIADWAQAAVQLDSANKLLSGYPDGTFAPLKNIRRDEAASLIVRLAHFKEE